MISSLQSHFIVTGGDKTMIRIYGAGDVGGNASLLLNLSSKVFLYIDLLAIFSILNERSP